MTPAAQEGQRKTYEKTVITEVLLASAAALFLCTGAMVKGTFAFRAVFDFANAKDLRHFFRHPSAAVYLFSIFTQPAAANDVTFSSVFMCRFEKPTPNLSPDFGPSKIRT